MNVGFCEMKKLFQLNITNFVQVMVFLNLRTGLFQEIQLETKYDMESLVCALKRLCAGAECQCILVKKPTTIDYEPTNSFSVNCNFNPNKPR